MKATIQKIDVLDLRADALIYSTNVLLNCSGGVGSCLVMRYGKHVQDDLHSLLRNQGTRFAQRGSIFQLVSTGMPYSKVFHVVPIDEFYDTTSEIVADILRRCLTECVEDPTIRSVALSVLATGYGHLDFDEFFRIASEVFAEEDFASIEVVTICIYDEYLYSLARRLILEENLILKEAQ
jgi:O-acetyl-ADP-ribose deacetylase (regulator of RNase III)